MNEILEKISDALIKQVKQFLEKHFFNDEKTQIVTFQAPLILFQFVYEIQICLKEQKI